MEHWKYFVLRFCAPMKRLSLNFIDRQHLFLTVTSLITWCFGAWLFGFHGDSPLCNHNEMRSRTEKLQQIQMDEGQYRIFYRAQERFYDLSAEEQDKWRTFYEEINAAPDKNSLLQTLDGYRHWLTTLGATEQIEVKSRTLSDEKRLDTIREIQERQISSKDPLFLGPPPLFPGMEARPTDRDLATFLGTLSPQQQNVLLGMPPKLMISQLEMDYFRMKYPIPGHRPPPFPPRR